MLQNEAWLRSTRSDIYTKGFSTTECENSLTLRFQMEINFNGTTNS